MEEIIGLIIPTLIQIVLTFVIVSFCVKKYKQEKENEYKFLYLTTIVCYGVLALIYIFDRYNLPSVLGWTINVNSQNWLSFLGSYLPGIISTIVGAIMLLWVTVFQINTNREDNEQRDRETLRIQNLPLLKYDIKAEDRDIELNINDLILTKYSTKDAESNLKAHPLNITIKNIGANTIRNIKVYLEADFLNKSVCLLGQKTQVPMEKSKMENIIKWINLPIEASNYNIKLRICYEDILTNWYEQEVIIDYNVTNWHNGCNTDINLDYKVKEEMLLNNK